MADLIQDICEDAGVTEKRAEVSCGSVLHLIQQRAPDDAFAEVLQCIPEAQDWMAAAEEHGAVPAAAETPEPDRDLLNNEDEGVREAYQASKWDPTGGMGAMVERVEEVFSGGKNHVSALHSLITAFEQAGMEGAAAAQAGPHIVRYLHESLGDDSFHALTREVPLLEHLAKGGSNSWTDTFNHRLSRFFRH
jgi:hypothetical protein